MQHVIVDGHEFTSLKILTWVYIIFNVIRPASSRDGDELPFSINALNTFSTFPFPIPVKVIKGKNQTKSFLVQNEFVKSKSKPSFAYEITQIYASTDGCGPMLWQQSTNLHHVFTDKMEPVLVARPSTYLIT